ncbi:DUF934 domain-containing protein [Acinetobacter sp. B5B]|uniref:DUF934 domain-containing protein n=1 Tax=Acinetobacter baretiae TaxID=2605383 RepID=UPI0018C1D749|nr:DUF934 domain-containing protein [Acinetobacter baretiae]MBF7683230.1 DUF934 domain-containing protein [Acinetobacter baretiae]MBF7684403.1 DUF934 domain-containing protein [Acinetobacter baretiae]
MLNLDFPVLNKDGLVTQNSYQAITETGELPSTDVLLDTTQLDLLSQINGKVALLITANDSPEEHVFPLADLDCIFIEFAGFNDGRGYSFATLLRRQGFTGELRAVGDIFKDVLNYLKRSGFDSFVLKEGKSLEEAKSGLNDFTQPYQMSTAVPNAHYQTGQV